MKRKLSFLGICLLLIFCFVGCGEKKAESQVFFESQISQLKQGALSTKKVEDFDQTDKAFLKILQKATCNIKEVRENGEASEIDVHIKAVNMPAYMSDLMTKMMPLAFSGFSEETIQANTVKFFEDLANKKDLSFLEKDATVCLEKNNGKWEIKNKDEIFSIFVAGMDKAFN